MDDTDSKTGCESIKKHDVVVADSVKFNDENIRRTSNSGVAAVAENNPNAEVTLRSASNPDERPLSGLQAHPEWGHMRVGTGGTHLEHRHSQRSKKGDKTDKKAQRKNKRVISPVLMSVPIGLGISITITGLIILIIQLNSTGFILGMVLLGIGVLLIVVAGIACIVFYRRAQQFPLVHYQTNRTPMTSVTTIDYQNQVQEQQPVVPARPETQYFTNPDSGPQINYSFSSSPPEANISNRPLRQSASQPCPSTGNGNDAHAQVNITVSEGAPPQYADVIDKTVEQKDMSKEYF
ncbi:unnamed protein product [Owenia fusiformis]|uniref:Uncharacterized protein n=1 Tax=Owenia fusiformis TaxID=6347 RepID=A0A8J1UQE8_OWEFU|nr:unnamed protein product [Owenia fusiformis]